MRKHLTKVKTIGAVTCFLVLFFIINFWSDLSQQILNQQQSSLAQELTINKAVQIEHLIADATNTFAILKSTIHQDPSQLDNLSSLANIIVKNSPAIKHIRLSPNNITSHVFPETLIPRYKGTTILTPALTNNTSPQNAPIYSQPQLINNQYHIKSHIPLHINNKHWGYISYDINLDILFDNSRLDILEQTLYSYQLINRGKYNKSTILIESSTPLKSDFYTAAIRIPNNEWMLNLSFNSHLQSSLSLINLVFSVMLASAFTLIVFLGISEPSRLRQKIKRLTKQFKSHELIFSQVMANVNDEIYVSDRNGNIYLNSSNSSDNHHLPANLLLQGKNQHSDKNMVFEQDGKTIIHPSEHPLNKSLFNNESIFKTVVLSPNNSESYPFELRTQPIYDELFNQVGALCIGRKIEVETENISTNTCRNIILDMLAHEKPINSIFEHIMAEIQLQLENTVVAITLISGKTQQISNVISKDLPSFFVDTLVGLPIQDRLMSNVNAIYNNKLTIVEDINIHPFWVNYKMLAQQANLRSCWSQPIHDANNNVLGTVDIYSKQVFETIPAAVMLLKESAILCSLTLDKHHDSHRLQKMSLAVQHSTNAVLITDSNGFVEYINPQYTLITGFAPVEKLSTLITVFDKGITPEHIISDIKQHLKNNQQWQGEVKSTTKNRGEYWAMATITPIISDENTTNHLVFVFSDVTQINQNISRINYHDAHDPLTKLYNRQTFEHRLQFLFSKSKEDNRIHSICAINIDQYDEIEKHGYEATDDLLRQTGQLLSQQLRQRDTLARLSDDQFVVLMEDCNKNSALNTARALSERNNGFEFHWQGHVFNMSLSIGISEITSDSASPKLVVQQADIACEQAKKQHDISVLSFTREFNYEPLTKDIFWAKQIKEALEQHQFQLFVQPIINLDSNESNHYELLLRLRDDEGNLVNPSTFLPAAIRYNLSTDIDKYVIDKIQQWSLEHPSMMSSINKISINLNESSLIDESFTYYLIELASNHNSLFDHLIFEFSEYHLVNNLSHCRRFINAISHTQCQFSIDQFGRGLSSFSHLKNLPVDFIKIDGGLISSMNDDPFKQVMINSIQNLNQTLDIKTIALHVENEDMVQSLKESNIKYGQGFHLGKSFLLNDILDN